MGLFWVVPISILILFEFIADILSKEYALKGTALFWGLALLAYLIGNMFWLWAIRDGAGLARGAIIFSVGSALFAVIIGVAYFHEPAGTPQYIGFILGLVSLILILS